MAEFNFAEFKKSLNELIIKDKFIEACRQGDLEYVQNNYTPEVFKYDDYASFRWACVHGRLEVAQYLLEKNPTFDYQMWNNWIMKECCLRGREEIVRWLESLWAIVPIEKYHISFRKTLRAVLYLYPKKEIDEKVQALWETLPETEKREFLKINPPEECFVHLEIDPNDETKLIKVPNLTQPLSCGPNPKLVQRIKETICDQMNPNETIRVALLENGFSVDLASRNR